MSHLFIFRVRGEELILSSMTINAACVTNPKHFCSGANLHNGKHCRQLNYLLIIFRWLKKIL